MFINESGRWVQGVRSVLAWAKCAWFGFKMAVSSSFLVSTMVLPVWMMALSPVVGSRWVVLRTISTFVNDCEENSFLQLLDQLFTVCETEYQDSISLDELLRIMTDNDDLDD